MLDRVDATPHLGGCEARTSVNKLAIGQGLEGLAQLRGRVDEKRFERDDRGAFGLHGSIASNFDLAQHLRRAVGRLGNGGGNASQDRPCRRLGIERVALAVVSALASIAVIDFDDADRLASHKTRESYPIRSRPLNAEGLDRAESLRPRDHFGVSGTVRAGAQAPEPGSQTIDGDRDVHVLMGIYPDDNGLCFWRNRRLDMRPLGGEAMTVAGERTGL